MALKFNFFAQMLLLRLKIKVRSLSMALVQSNCYTEILTRQGINREYEVGGVPPKLALFGEVQERQQKSSRKMTTNKIMKHPKNIKYPL